MNVPLAHAKPRKAADLCPVIGRQPSASVILLTRPTHPLLAGTVVEASRRQWQHPYAVAAACGGGNSKEVMAGAGDGESGGEESARGAVLSHSRILLHLIEGKQKFFSAVTISRCTNRKAWTTYVVFSFGRGIFEIGREPLPHTTRGIGLLLPVADSPPPSPLAS